MHGQGEGHAKSAARAELEASAGAIQPSRENKSCVCRRTGRAQTPWQEAELLRESCCGHDSLGLDGSAQLNVERP